MVEARIEISRVSDEIQHLHQPHSNNTAQVAHQKRRSHKKSRAGCGNCKLRRVKCDESHPCCSKCAAYGLDCDYDPKSTGFHFAGETTFSVQTRNVPVKELAVALGSISTRPAPMPSLRGLETQFTPHATMPADLGLLAKFQERTVLTVGPKSSAKMYQNEVFKLALQYPFLTHVVLTLTILHDHHLTGVTSLGSRATLHWLEGTSQFGRALIKPGIQSQRDALWACAAMLGCIQFACIEARTPEEAWPLKEPSTDDLSWLKMSDGKKAVWKICDPSKSESVFNHIRGHPDPYRPFKFDGHTLSNVTREFREVFGLDLLSDKDNNPYHSAAMCLASLLPQECNRSTILWFLAFISQIDPKLKALLAEKEPKALLLVACWYAKIFKYQWWIHRRGLLEGQAICIYLDRHYSHAKSIQNLLTYPKMAFGLIFAGGETDQLESIMPIRSRTLAE